MQFRDLWARYQQVRDELLEREPCEGPINPSETDDELRHAEEILSEVILGHPESFKKVRCWMVDANGCEGEAELTEELVKEVNKDAVENLGHQYIQHFGALAAEVREVMMKWNLTDSGGGCGCWQLGCHCTEEEAKDLCTELYHRFHHAIDAGLLVVERKPWSLRLAE